MAKVLFLDLEGVAPLEAFDWYTWACFFNQRSTRDRTYTSTLKRFAFEQDYIQLRIARAGDYVVQSQRVNPKYDRNSKWSDWYYILKPANDPNRMLRLAMDFTWRYRLPVLCALGMFRPAIKAQVAKRWDAGYAE